MAEKSTLYTRVINDQNVNVGDLVKWDYDEVHTGIAIEHFPSGTSVLLKYGGIYDISAVVSFTITTTGPVEVELLSNGEVISSTIVQATATEPIAIPVMALVKELKSCECADNRKTIALRISAIGVVNNATLKIVKEA